MATITEQLAEWSTALSWEAAPQRVRDLCVSQVLAHLGALFGGARHPMGRRVIAGFGRPLSDDAARSAYVIAALTMALDYDDTVFAGHVSHSSVGVPLAYARSAGLDGAGLLRSILAATEVAARVTAAATLGPFRGQTAAHTHLAGAVAGRCVAQRLGASTMVDAMGIAFAQPPWPLNHAFFGSDAKLLTASTPIRTGLDAVDAARAGLRGAPGILEHPEGFLARFATIPLAEAAGGLGERWHTDTLSIKVHPGCAYIDGAIDAALRLHGAVAAGFDQISAVSVDASIFTVGMEQRAAPYLSGPSSGLAALNFSTGYSVATALLRGGLEVEDFAPPRVEDERVWRVARLVEVRHDAALSRRALLATAPIGAALRMAGDAAAGWLAAGAGITEDEARALLAAPDPGFEAAEKAIGARVRVAMRDGSEHAAEVDIAEGAAGPDTRARHREISRTKLVGNAAPLVGEAAAADIADRVERLPGAGTDEVRALLDRLANALT
ncbi:MAG TPA: MmgE/PrpD family protein [Candidatus Dormibacteraeota bacterium]|nr:MmgE/PrpD family protein [Candidatus Dormibacteraeota bacterium]